MSGQKMGRATGQERVERQFRASFFQRTVSGESLAISLRFGPFAFACHSVSFDIGRAFSRLKILVRSCDVFKSYENLVVLLLAASIALSVVLTHSQLRKNLSSCCTVQIIVAPVPGSLHMLLPKQRPSLGLI